MATLRSSCAYKIELFVLYMSIFEVPSHLGAHDSRAET